MTSRKDKIKNIAIVFLTLMLLLTFFSNTIMNYSLVEVSTQQVTSDTITTKVRGSGTVEANDGYSVTISESRKIATVEVKTGAEVEKGDLLFTLEDSESDELVAARKSLTEAKKAYETAVINAGLTVDERKLIEAGKGSSLSDKQNSLTAAQTAVDNAQAAVDSAQATVDDLTAQKEKLSASSVDTSAEEAALNDAKKNLSAATTDQANKKLLLDDAQEKYDTLKSNGAAQDQIDAAKATLDAASSAYLTASTNYNNCNQAVTDAQNALEAKQNSSASATQISAITAQLTDANKTLTANQAALEEAKTKLEELKTGMTGEIDIASQYEALVELEEQVAELEADAVGAEITSPITGTVTEIAYTAGQTVSPEEPMMLIQPENKAFLLKFTVTANQAKRIKPGDPANILNNWYGNDISAEVLTVRKDPNDKNTSVVTCELTGEVSVGDNYTLSIGEQSANYDYVVPTSSIREDSNGNFILIIESKSTPLGNRYYARRVNVEVITSDDTKSAVSGALEGYEYVITTTTEPVEENQQVRLAE